eukprot:gene48832-59790_t
MSSTTVAEFANELKKSTDTLLEQLKSAGVAKASASDVLTDGDKHSLLNFLQNSHGTASPERKKITLEKKQTTEIKQADATGKARTIQVEVRKKRTFIKRDDEVAVPEAAEEPVVAAPVIDTEPALRPALVAMVAPPAVLMLPAAPVDTAPSALSATLPPWPLAAPVVVMAAVVRAPPVAVLVTLMALAVPPAPVPVAAPVDDASAPVVMLPEPLLATVMLPA